MSTRLSKHLTLAALACCLAVACGGDDGDAGGSGGDPDASPGDAAGAGGQPAQDAAPSPDAEADAAPEAPGFARLTFATTEGVRANPTLVDPLRGRVMGDVFLSVDVGLMGPVEGAPRFGSVDLMAVDLTAVDSQSAPWTSEALPPGEYIFLGMMDLDGNAAEFDDSPDPGDLATLPRHRFTIVAGRTTDAVVLFELVFN